MSPIQQSSLEDSNSVRLSICSGITLSSSTSTSSPISPNVPAPKEESLDAVNLSERDRASNTVLSVMDGASAVHRRRRTALLLDQPSKVIGNP